MMRPELVRMLTPGAKIAIVAETSFWDSPRMLYILKAEQVRLHDVSLPFAWWH